MLKFFLVICCAFIVGEISTKELGLRNYNGYQVLTAIATHERQAQVLKDLEGSHNYDFWSGHIRVGTPTDIMVSPELVSTLTADLDLEGIEWNVKVEDVGKLVLEQHIQNRILGTERQASSSMTWTAYQRWSVIEPWIKSLANYPVATVSIIGQSYERRNIYMVKVSTGKLANGANKRVIFIDANIHAREWISGATASWMLNELVTNSAKYTAILDQLDFYFVPYLNIDGYEFCHTTDRLWRKTRSVNAGTSCRGADPNRNFSFKWGGENTSRNQCSDQYRGSAAFSERETAALRDAFVKIQAQANIRAYITLHASGQFWLLPWGYTKGVYPSDYSELLAWGKAATAALTAVHGTQYTTGQGADLLYGVGGASDDWAKNAGVKFTTTVELRDGGYGFLLPPAQIIPSGQETWAAVLKTAEIVIASK